VTIETVRRITEEEETRRQLREVVPRGKVERYRDDCVRLDTISVNAKRDLSCWFI
jgi:hypothetical protein